MLNRSIKLILFILFIHISFSSIAQAQEDSTKMILKPLVMPQKGEIEWVWMNYKGWLFKAGDNLDWAKTDWDDTNWMDVPDTHIFINHPPLDEQWEGNAWFRLHFQIDSTLKNKEVIFFMTQIGAAEIYLNGEKIYELGKVGDSYETEQAVRVHRQMFPVLFGDTLDYVIAVRFSDHFNIFFEPSFDMKYSGQTADVLNMEVRYAKYFSALLSLGGAIFVTLGLFHLILFLFVRTEPLNFWFGFFSLVIAITQAYFLYTRSYALYTLEWHFLYTMAAFPFHWLLYLMALRFLYQIFYPSPPRIWKYLWIYYCLFVPTVLIVPLDSIGEILIIVYLVVINAEILRVIVIALLRKKKKSILLGIALSLFILFWTLGMTWPDYISFYVIAFSALVGAMQLVVIQTNIRREKKLEENLREITALSNLTLKQEKEKKQILENQKEELANQVATRTMELREANEELNQSNEEIASQRDNLERTLKHLKQAQAQLVQSEKMSSLGQLTAGIAHEINNPVNFIAANIDSLKANIDDIMVVLNQYNVISEDNYHKKLQEIEELKESYEFDMAVEELEQLISGIIEGANRTTQIIKGLRTFSRLDEDALKSMDLHENIDSTLTLLQNRYKDKIEIIKQYGKIPSIEAYPGKLNQVFMNILANAIEAIPEQGTISIKTDIIDNQQILISIKDTGLGMSEDILSRIFEPFFTTKDVGKGVGLGLSIVHSIIEKHQGKIEVASELGKGTEFKILLPIRST